MKGMKQTTSLQSLERGRDVTIAQAVSFGIG